MAATRNLQLARVLKIILDILFGGLVFVSVIMVLWIAGFGLLSRQANYLGTASIPVVLGTDEKSQFEVTFSGNPKDNISFAFLDETEGTLRLETDSALLVGISNAAKLILAIGLAYIFYLLRVVVQAIYEGDPFTTENASRIRRLGYTVLILGFLGPSVEHIAATEVLHRLPTTVPVLSPGPTFDAGIILASLFTLLLAHIWSYGLELERDRALTI